MTKECVWLHTLVDRICTGTPKDHPLLVSVPLGEPVVTRRVGLIRRAGRTLGPAAQQLYDFLATPTGAAGAAPSRSAAPGKRAGARSHNRSA